MNAFVFMQDATDDQDPIRGRLCNTVRYAERMDFTPKAFHLSPAGEAWLFTALAQDPETAELKSRSDVPRLWGFPVVWDAMNDGLECS